MTFPLHTKYSLGGWQRHLKKMFGKVNDERKPLETIARVTEMATGVSRAVREQDDDLQRQFFPRFLAWFLGLCNQLDVNLEEAVYASYPGVCPYCRKDQECTCKFSTKNITARLTEKSEIKKYQTEHECPANLREWVSTFGHIYGVVNKDATPIKMVGHFMEEMGEVCEIVRFHCASDVELENWKVSLSREEIEINLHQELADLFAWFCGLAFEVAVDADSEMREIYLESCPECNSLPCKCSPYKVHKQLRLGAKKRM